MSRRVQMRVLACLILCAAASLVGGAAVADGNTQGAAHSGGIYWGATIGTQFTGHEVPLSMRAAADFEHNEQKSPSILHFYWPLANCASTCVGMPFPEHGVEAIRRDGAIPLVTWMGDAGDSSSTDPRFSLKSILSGRWDAAIRKFALGAKRWGHPYFLRPDPEMNGDWLPWSHGVNDNTPAEYAEAWRHIYDIFQSVGSDNATWVWCPYVNWSSGLAKEYPGNQYVGWTCLDGYNWGTNPSSQNTVHRWMSFRSIFSSSYASLKRIAPDKPIMIGEFASSADGGSKSTWLTDALAQVPRFFPGIRAIVYFDWYSSGMDWSLESDPASETAFAAGIKSGIYLPNVFAGLTGTQIYPAP